MQPRGQYPRSHAAQRRTGGPGNLMLRAVVWNELEKLVRRRWLLSVLVTAAVVGLGIAIELASPQPADWRSQTREQMAQLRAAKDQLQSAPEGVPAGFQASLNAAIDQQLEAERYLLDHDIAPSDWYPAGRAIGTILKTGFGFLLLLFGGPGLAIGSTLCALLVLQPLAAVLRLALKDPAWLHFTFWPYLSPSTELTSQPTMGLGYSSAGLSLSVLLVWAVAFLVVGVVLFTRRSETS